MEDVVFYNKIINLFKTKSVKYSRIEEPKGLVKVNYNNFKMNPIGFEDGRWLRVINVGDGSVVELEGNVLVCKPLNPNREDYQKFKCIFKDSGAFAIAAKYQNSPDNLMVWDYLPHRRLLMQKKQSNSSRNNQSWRSEHVPGMQSMYFVLSAPEGENCLKHVGNGKQILVVRKTDQITGDKFAQWKLERLEPILPS